jgi:hypothetical protein
VERLDIDQRADAGGTEPGEEVGHGPVIGMRVFLLRMDGGSKEFEEAADRGVAGAVRPRRPWRAVEGVRHPDSGRADSWV